MSFPLSGLVIATLLLTLGGSSTLETELDSEPHSLPGRVILQAGVAPAPGPFQFGAVLPNSDPTCDPQWAYQTGCYSDYSCAKGHICTCKNGDKCSDGSYFGIFLCPCDEAPQLPPTPPPPPPPPPPSTCINTVKRTCPSGRNTTDAVAKCTALGGTILSISATRYSCTCCTGSASIYALLPASPPPPPYQAQSNIGADIQRKVGIIIGCTWGGIIVLIATVVTCYCCYCKKKAPGRAARRNDLEQPPLIARPTSSPKTKSGGGSDEAGAKKWFEPGYSGPTFKTTGAGLFVSKTIPKNVRFVELFASAYAQDGNGAGTSGHGGPRTHHIEMDESPPLSGGTYSYSSGARYPANEQTAKGKEPEAPMADAAPASIEGLPEDEICIVCCNAPKECVFVPCGHHATCLACGRLVQQGGQGCPVCRRPIERVLKIYEA